MLARVDMLHGSPCAICCTKGHSGTFTTKLWLNCPLVAQSHLHKAAACCVAPDLTLLLLPPPRPTGTASCAAASAAQRRRS